MRFIPLIIILFGSSWSWISSADVDAPAAAGEAKGKGFSHCLRAGPGKMFHGCFSRHKGESRRGKGRHHSRLHEAKGGPGGRVFKEKAWAKGGGGRWREVKAARNGEGRGVKQNGSNNGGYRAASAFASFAEGYTASKDGRTPSASPPGQYQPNAVGPDGLPDQGEGPDVEELADAPQGEAGFMAPAELEAAISGDLADCMQSLSSAQTCCGNPMVCGGRLSGGDTQSLASVMDLLQKGPSAGGVADYCGQLTKAAQNSRDVNSGLAGVCFESQDSCETTCEDLRADYVSFLQECNGCESAGALQAAISRLDSAQKTCSSLSANVASLADNGFEAAAAQAVATHCQGVATAQSTGGGSAGTAPPTMNEKLGATVTLEDSAGARRADGSLQRGGPQVEMQVDASSGFKGYARGASAGGGTQQPYAGAWSNAGSSRGTAAAGSPGVNTQSPRAGGPAAAGNSGGASDKSGLANKKGQKDDVGGKSAQQKNGSSDRNPASASAPPPISGNEDQFAGQNSLEQYLPQGVRTAMRRMAHAKEINAKEENLFLRVSAKFREKCQLGVLWQCD